MPKASMNEAGTGLASETEDVSDRELRVVVGADIRAVLITY